MPIYEYHCEPCDHTFETLIRGQGDVARCPRCNSIDLVKRFSVPAVAQKGRSSSPLPICQSSDDFHGCGPGHCRTGMCSFD
jgi:putative FmdB family regulatory protein